jgi:ElaB/YqjD/DUF883 family membrane-anchored ribosome-binding protein
MSVSNTDLKEGRINDGLGTQLDALSAQVEANIERGRNAWAEWKANFSAKGSELFHSLDEQAHTSPWPLVCGATAAGLLLGALLGRR